MKKQVFTIPTSVAITLMTLGIASLIFTTVRILENSHIDDAIHRLADIAKPEIDQNIKKCDKIFALQPTWCPEKIESLTPNYMNFSEIYEELKRDREFNREVNEIDSTLSDKSDFKPIYQGLKKELQHYGQNHISP